MTIPKLDAVLPKLSVKPAACELECHVCFQQQELFDYLVKEGIQPVGFMQNISDIVSTSSDLQKYLFRTDQTQEIREEEYARMISEFSAVLDSRSDIYNIAAVSDTDQSVVNRGDSSLIPYAQMARQEWFRNTMANPDGISISASHGTDPLPGRSSDLCRHPQ